MDSISDENNRDMFKKHIRDDERYYKEMDQRVADQEEDNPPEKANDDMHFNVRIDCSHYRPDEIEVKTIYDNIEVHGLQKDKYGRITREFDRRIRIPEECDANDLRSSFGPNGELIIEAPKKRLVDTSRHSNEKRHSPARETPIKLIQGFALNFSN